MSNNKVVIGGDTSELALKADNEARRANQAVSELTMQRRRINTFFSAIIEVRFPESAPVWATHWYDWLLTGEIPVAAEEVVIAVESEVVLETEVGLIEEEPTPLGQDSLLEPTDPAIAGS